ncbi:S8 family serine peptidase [Desulforudis sp. DRI-14]|uniref:S8 family serine peptidase n=1 Tax=Desulforudis sp. DRI-14 TaxID=3459793 RepID=UPI0040432F08
MRFTKPLLPLVAVLVALAFLSSAAVYFGGVTLPGTGPEEGQDQPAPNKENLYVVRIDPGTDPQLLAGWLEAAGARLGDPVGDSRWLLRVPQGAEAKVNRVLKGRVEVLEAEDRLGPAVDANSGEELEITISTFGAGDKEFVAGEVERLGGKVTRGLSESGTTLRAVIPAGAVKTLASLPQVVFVEQYRPPVFLNDRARDIAGVSPVAVRDFVTARGLTGAGQIVAIADSGLGTGSYADLHPDLANVPGQMPKVIYLESLAGGDKSDPTGHGTHVAGTVAGTGAASGGKFKGVAPGAGIFFQAILGKNGKIDPPADLYALFEPAYAGGARIHVNGWGGETNAYLSSSSQIDRFVRRHPDFTVVFGAGNNGPGPGSLTPEANSKNALVFGAGRNARPVFGEQSADPRLMASFSSRGPAADGRIKPDLVAPGTSIVSAKSGLIEGNFPANSAYTRMQGTSMAAAVGGGAVALMREYFIKEEDMASPSAALIKAALINGARPLPGVDRQAQGFGLLDVAGTVTALKERRFAAADETGGVAHGASRTYRCRVTGSGAPLKATLAWTDPQAAPGAQKALVNDLDLVVRGPSGTFYGNDFGREGKRDTLNNVEQVVVDNPQPGEYLIEVKGAAVAKNVVPGAAKPAQDYALVFGQPLERHIVTALNGDSLVLDGGGEIDRKSAALAVAVDGKKTGLANVPPGADIYSFTDASGKLSAYIYGRTWRAGGVRLLKAGGAPVLVRVSRENREGGYRLAGDSVPVSLNGRPVTDLNRLPVGMSVTASLNPSTQEIWSVEGGYEEVDGILAAVDPLSRSVRLLDDSRTFYLHPDAATFFNDTVVDGDRDNLPFGASLSASAEQLAPGMPVKLGVAPSTAGISCITARRSIAVGHLGQADAAGRFSLGTGVAYSLLPGAPVTRNGQPASPSSLQPGDLVIATLIPDSRTCISITAFSAVMFGRVIFATDDSLYLSAYDGTAVSLQLGKDTEVYRWGLLAGSDQLYPGQWVRVILSPGTKEARRIDIADDAAESTEHFLSYQKSDRTLRTAEGGVYPLGSRAVVTKNGLGIEPSDLFTGEEITVTALRGPGGEPVAVAVKGKTLPSAEPPALSVLTIIPVRDGFFARGKTTASTLYLCVPGEQRAPVKVSEQGEFFAYIPFRDGVSRVQFIALDGATGAIAGQSVDLPVPPKGLKLRDVDGHWAELEIRAMADKGFVAGYPDGAFRPDKPVTRAELAVLMARVAGLVPNGDRQPSYTDAGRIPSWARGTISAAQELGLVAGYRDGAFKPARLISRVEGTAMVARMCAWLNLEPARPPENVPYQDWQDIPAWARRDVVKVYALGLLGGDAATAFRPQSYLTRAEAAVILHRLSNAINGG